MCEPPAFRFQAHSPRRCMRLNVASLDVAVDCPDPYRQAEFWAQAVVYKVSRRNPR